MVVNQSLDILSSIESTDSILGRLPTKRLQWTKLWKLVVLTKVLTTKSESMLLPKPVNPDQNFMMVSFPLNELLEIDQKFLKCMLLLQKKPSLNVKSMLSQLLISNGSNSTS